MPRYNCIVTETRDKSWANPGTSTTKFSYEGKVDMDSYSDTVLGLTSTWSCSKK